MSEFKPFQVGDWVYDMRIKQVGQVVKNDKAFQHLIVVQFDSFKTSYTSAGKYDIFKDATLRHLTPLEQALL